MVSICVSLKQKGNQKIFPPETTVTIKTHENDDHLDQELFVEKDKGGDYARSDKDAQ